MPESAAEEIGHLVSSLEKVTQEKVIDMDEEGLFKWRLVSPDRYVITEHHTDVLKRKDRDIIIDNLCLRKKGGSTIKLPKMRQMLPIKFIIFIQKLINELRSNLVEFIDRYPDSEEEKRKLLKFARLHAPRIKTQWDGEFEGWFERENSVDPTPDTIPTNNRSLSPPTHTRISSNKDAVLALPPPHLLTRVSSDMSMHTANSYLSTSSMDEN